MANIIQQFKNANGDNIFPLAYAQGGCKMDLLWTNPNPASSFSAQTISLDLSEYSIILVAARTSTSTTSNDIAVGLIGIQSLINCIDGSSTSAGGNVIRRFTALTSGVEFTTGARPNVENNNSLAIPYQIYGIKMSYIVPTSVHGLQYVEV